MADFNELAKSFTAIGCLAQKIKREGGPEKHKDLIKLVEDAWDALDKGSTADLEIGLLKAVEGQTAIRKQRRALAAEAQTNVSNFFDANSDVNPVEIMLSLLSLGRGSRATGMLSVELKAEGIAAMANGKMNAFLTKHRDKVYGKDQDFADVTRAVFGEPATERGKLIAEGVKEMLEFIRLEAKRRGFQIDKLDRYLPQHHDNMKVRGSEADYRSGKAKVDWVETTKSLLHRERMKSWKTGNTMTNDELDEFLGAMWQRIADNELSEIDITTGLAKRNYARRIEAERILHFKDADAWAAYQTRYGKWGGNLFDNLAGYVKAMSNDIAMVDTFGPNPTVGVNHAFRLAQNIANKKGKPLNSFPDRFLQLYKERSGDAHVVENATIGNVGAGLRNLSIAASMGSSWFMALTDLAFAGAASRMAGLSATRTFGAILSEFAATPSGGNRQLLLSTGYVSDVWTSMAGSEMRYLGEMTGPNWTRWLADRTLRTSFLQPWTEAGKVAFAHELISHLMTHRAKSWTSMDRRMQGLLRRYGLTEAEWDIWRSAKPWKADNGAEYIRPDDVITSATPETEAVAQEAARKVQAMILAEQNIAIPHPGDRERALLRVGSKAGTLWGETVRTGTLLKTFPVTAMSILIQRMIMDKMVSGLDKLQPLGIFIAGSTLIAGMGLQASGLTKGREPRPMDNFDFWTDALIRGGSLGIAGDMMYQNINRGAAGVFNAIGGPILPNLVKLTAEIPKVFDERDFRERELVNFARRLAPGQSLWFVALALERIVIDTVVEMADPKARDYFRNRRKYAREEGTEYWAPPGENLFDSLEALTR